jgi:hypothetical protein
MPQGVPTPDYIEVEFRKHYLVTGNIRAAARQAKIPATTGHDLATRALADPEFVQARAAMYARALPDAERMLIGGMEIAYDRLEAGPEAVVSSDMKDGASKITIQDPGPAYLRGIADGVKVLTAIRKTTDPAGDGTPTRIEVIFTDGDAA